MLGAWPERSVGNPFLDRLPGWLDGLHGVDLEGWRRSGLHIPGHTLVRPLVLKLEDRALRFPPQAPVEWHGPQSGVAPHRPVLRFVDRLHQLGGHALSTILRSDGEAADGEAAQLEQRVSIQQAVSRLDSNLAVVLKLFYQESFTVNEIAGVLEIPPGTVKSRLFYARKQLKEYLSEYL